MDVAAVPAVYDPNRLPNGQFVKGNSIRLGTPNDIAKRFQSLRALWFEATSVDDMKAVRAELVKLCLECPVPDVKFKAIVYFCDRMLGKPTERVELDVSQDAGPARLPELTPDEVVILQKVVRKTGGE